MELDHTEAIKHGMVAGLGVAFVSIYAVRGEIATGRLCALLLRGIRIQRRFHVIHHEARRVTASARAFMELLEQAARSGRLWGAWGIGMMLMMLVFWGVVIVGIVLLIRWLMTQGRESSVTDPALDIRWQRYARGDITKEEFEAKKKDLA
jgi:putative membrane protein